MKPLTIAELVDRTDVPSATIHYYLRHGLLPSPRRIAANRFAYDERHVVGLKLIRMLRERRGLSLPMIRRILPELLRLEGEEAFSPVIWDKVLAPRLSARRLPSNRLLEAAKEAFTRRAFDDVNVDDLCRAARIAKGSFYRHYRSKEDLFFEAADSLSHDVQRQFAALAGSVGIDPKDAPALLATVLGPRLPVFLELFARALQGRPGYEAVARRILQESAEGIGQSVAGSGSPAERGIVTLRDALIDMFRGVVGTGAVPRSRPHLVTPGGAGA
jgi:AcrR family transcriptional regulator